MSRIKWRGLIGAGLIGSLFFFNAEVDAAVSAPVSFEERIQALEKEIALLKRLNEVNQEIAVKKERETPVVSAGAGGFGIKSKDGKFDLKIKGYVQADGRFYLGDERNPAVNAFTLRRVRPVFEGKLFGNTDFRIMPDFGGGSATIQDAYIDFKQWQKVQIRAGKFKSPFSLERLQSGTATTFIERAFNSSLAGNRDIGLDIHGDFYDGAISYDLAVMNGATDGASVDTDTNDGKDVIGRVFTHPFKNGANAYLKGLGGGLAASYGLHQGTSSSSNLPSTRSPGQLSVFGYRSGVYSDGERVRFSPQGYYYYGPFGLLGEYTWSNQDVRLGTQAGDLTNVAWHLSGSYVLTGENANFRGVTPRYNFDPANSQWGAFEAVARFQSLSIDDGTFERFANSATAIENAKGFGVGLNWYLNRALKAQINYEKLFYDGGNRESEDVLLTRFQVNY